MFLSLLLTSSLTFAQTSIPSNKKLTDDVKKLFAILLPGAKQIEQGEFSLKSCPDYQTSWLMLALMKKSFTASYKFAPQCDIDGSFSPQMEKNFSVPLKLQHIGEFHQVNMNTLLKISSEGEKLRLDVVVSDSLVESKKDKIIFSGKYAIAVEPLRFDDYENLGGEIHITKINDKVVDINEKIFIK